MTDISKVMVGIVIGIILTVGYHRSQIRNIHEAAYMQGVHSAARKGAIIGRQECEKIINTYLSPRRLYED